MIMNRYYGHRDYKLVDFHFTSLDAGLAGFLGAHNWLTVRTKNKNKEEKVSFFSKLESVDGGKMSEFGKQIRAYENEILFYEILMPEFNKYHRKMDESIIPKFYFSRSNLVVMEDCSQTGFVGTKSEDILDVDHIKLILAALAKLHAASIIYEEKKSAELGREYRIWEDYSEYLLEKFMRDDPNYLGYQWHIASVKCIHAIIDRLPEEEISREEFKQKFDELAHSCFELSKPAPKYRNVCCHGDMWRKNVLFRYEKDLPVACKLIDFQLIKYYPPMYDVLKFLYQVTTAETRQHHMDELTWMYYDWLCVELKNGGVDANKVIPVDEFVASIKYILPCVKIEALYYYTFQRTGFDFLEKLMTDEEAFAAYTFVDRSPIVSEKYYEGSYFKKWVDEMLFEVKDLIFKNGFSTEDCHTTIRNRLQSTNYTLVKYELNPVTEPNGFLGIHKKMRAFVNQKGKSEILQFFAKFLPTSEFQEFAIKSGAFDNETFMYDCVFKMMISAGIEDILDCVPSCYFTRRNDVLIFEDLNVRGYVPLNKHKALHYNQLCVIVPTLAKMHACCLILEEKLSKNGNPFRIVQKFAENLKEVCYIDVEDHIGKRPIQACIKGIKTHIDLFSDPESTITDDEFKRKAEKIYGKLMYEYSSPSTKYRNVICHGDLWASNILMKYENDKPVKCKLVDFQGVKRCPPAQDLMALIYLTTSRKFRANYMNEIIDIYHKHLGQTLAKYGYDVETLVPYNDFLDSCEYYKVFAIAQSVTHFHFIMATSEEMSELFKDADLCRSSFYDDRSELITKMCNKNAQYKFMLGQCIRDFRILCENLDI